ncbi:hypothetical protein NF343_05710 [Lactococcus formosensis]|uniref:hypothetical protein n=1 Tax=Lactococcus formosensis TaxID=1281486 RepID=UPI002434EB0A|nr:hypothetical protein [Lactococcus formosensis]MDG6176994.1 hypothetical protein [Lactococcus formosensis]
MRFFSGLISFPFPQNRENLDLDEILSPAVLCCAVLCCAVLCCAVLKDYSSSALPHQVFCRFRVTLL